MITRDEIKTVLKLPIDVIGGKEKRVVIDLCQGRIKSTQKYRGCDPDVSDIAMDFYTLIYNLDNNLVQGRKLLNTDFCGDTITSYKTLKKKVDNNQKTDKQLEDISHCLANFWLLPMDVGHSSSWTARRGLMSLSKSAKCKDWIQTFLKYYFDNLDAYKESFPFYTETFSSKRETFLKKHYLIEMEEKEIRSIEDYLDIYERRIECIVADKSDEFIKLIENQQYEVIR